MIFKYFLLGNLVSLCMKIINSVVVVGLYYGFLTTFSIGPSYLFLLRARVMEEEEGTEKELSAKTGFIMGQLMMFISIYYAPLHLALDRPHTITVLVLPYLLFHFFFECELGILQYKNRKRKSIRNLTITCVFLNNLIFQLLNQFLLPSSTLARLVNIYMFRSNNKMLFVTSSFVGWLIGHIFFMKWFGLVLFWIRKITPSRPKKYIRFYGDYALEKEDLLAISLTLISIYYLGRMPSPTITRRVGKIRSEISPWDENYLIWFEGRIVNSLFDYKQWNRPLRYIKNDNFKIPVIDEMSQYFFRIRPSYGKQIITFTCPPSLSTLWKMIQRKFKCYSPSQIKKPPGLYRSLVSINREKRRNLCNEFINRIKALGKGAPALDVLEKRTRLYNKKNKQNYLPKAYDPFLSGPYRKKLRGIIMDSPGIYTTKSWINRIHRLLVISFPELINTRDEDASITVKVLHKILVPDSDQYLRSDLRRSKIIERRRIRRKVPRWSYNLNTDSQDAEKENADEPTEYYAVLLRKYDRLVVYSDEDDQEINVNSDDELEEKLGEIALLDYPRERDPYRGLIKGSMRAQRRKIPIWRVYQPLFQSPLFLGRIRGAAFTSFVNIIEFWKYFFRNWLEKDPKFEVSTSDSEIEEEELVKSKSIWLEEMEIEDDDPLLERGKEFFDEMLYQGFEDVVLGLQVSRSLSLIAQSIFRKYILLPSTVIVKNIVRALLFKTPEWDADWRDWKKELHIYCTYNGVQISDRELPSNWLMGGIQIKVLFPFYPKPRRKSKLRSDPTKEKKRNADWKNKRKGKTKDSFYLTPWGGAKEKPFGPLKEQPSFFKPIWKKLEKRMRKELKKKSFSTLIRSFLIKGFSFLQEMPGILEDKIRWIQKITLFKKEKIKEFPKKNSSFLFPSELSKVHKPHKNRKDSRLNKKFQKKRDVRRSPAVRTDFSRTQKNDIFIRRIMVIREINNIAEELERRKMFLTPDRNSSSPYETDWGDKRSESQKHIWQILKGKSVRFIRKWECFVNSFNERIYVDIFLCTINSFRIHAQPFFESSKKMINKYIDNIEKNKEEFFETNQNTIHFISTLKESLFHITNISNEESKISRYLSSLSQAYVFYNLSQTQVINKYHLRSVLQDHGARLFFKDRIKEYLWTLGILDAKSSSKRLPNSGMNEWKNWLRGHYQYNFSQTRWSRLVSQKWRNKVRKRHTSQNKESKKDSYEKDQSIHCEKQKNYIMNSLPIQKYKFTKNYRYDLLSHKYIHYEDKKDSYSYISISDYLGDNDTDKNMGRKYLEWRTILYFSRKNIGIKHRINRDTGTNIKKKTKTGTNNYQITDNKDLFSLMIHQERNPSNQKNFFDWMGMNEEMLYRSISNQEMETWFFSELVPLYSAYKSKPRIIPIKLLFLNNESFSEQEKRYLREFEEYLRKEAEKKEKEQSDQKNLGSDPPNQQKDLLVDSAESDIKNRRKQSQSKKDISGPQLNLLMRKHLVSQLNINSSLNLPEIMDIRTFSFLLKMMKYSNDIDIYSIEIGDIRINFLATLRRLTYPILDVPTFIKRGIITIEPIRLFLKLDGQSIMYQIIGISLVHKNKNQTNEICREKKYDLLVPENIPSTRRRRELRIRICFNSASGRIVDRYPVLVDRYNMRNCVHFLGEDKHIDTDRNKLIQFKLFLWPNYRLEDLACMNRYWFDTNNGSRFSMSRIHMYPLQN